MTAGGAPADVLQIEKGKRMAALKTLGILASPRRDGNTDLLLQRALCGAEEAGSQVEYLRLCDYRLEGCTECEACQSTGSCGIDDDYDRILDKMLAADRIIFATPVFFMTVPAQAKALIDRGQCLWMRQTVLHKPLFEPRRDRRGMIIAVGGSRGRLQFDCVQRPIQSCFDCLEVSHVSSLFINQVDEKAAVLKHPDALEAVFRFGCELGADTRPAPDKPVRIDLP